MNNYPIWWNQTITVYNKFENPATRVITWYRTVLKNCFWKYREDKLTIGETSLETASTICRVPKNSLFKDKYDWEQSSDREQYFTFGSGDIVVKGEVDDVISEYETGHRSSDLLTKYKKLQGCMTVHRCSINTGVGIGTEHYYVKGL